MAWRITYYVLENRAVNIGVLHDNIPMPHQFRLLDDDGEVYFLGESSDNSSQRAFQPLDYAMAEYGCTEIQYLVNGKWETL